MRFMSIVTSPQPMKAPTPALMEAMGKLAEREIKAGRMIDMGGLMPIALAGAQLRIPGFDASRVLELRLLRRTRASGNED